jgi:hypothetical protein
VAVAFIARRGQASEQVDIRLNLLFLKNFCFDRIVDGSIHNTVFKQLIGNERVAKFLMHRLE